MKKRIIPLCIVIALLLSITSQTIAVSGAAISSSADYSSSNGWIAQHIEYSSSDEYSQEIVPGFHSRMLAVFRDALDDDSIKGYNSAKFTAELLDLNPDLNEVDVYTILLAEIMYSRPGMNIAESSYEISLTSSMVNTTQSLLNLVDVAEDTKELSAETLKSIIDLGELIQSTDLNTSDLGNAYSKFIHLIEENFNDVQVKTALKADATLEVFSFAIDTGFEICDSIVDTMHYVNNYIAYQETSEQFQRILEQFLIYLYENMGNHGLDGVDAFSELGITEAIFNWGDLSVAVADFLKTTEQYEQDVSSAVAEYAVEKIHQTGTAVSENAKRTLIVFGLDFICAKIPILNAIPILKNSLNVGLVLAEYTTNVDDKAYLLSMLTKTYCISVMLDEIVQNCANDMLTKKENVLYYASVFDEAVDLYKGTQLIAIEYALNYTKILLNESNSELNDYSKGGFLKRIFKNQDKLEQTVVWYENSLELLEAQRIDIMAISCHKITPSDSTDSINSCSFTRKRPSSIVAYDNGKESEEYHFTYNDLSQVVGMEAYRYEGGNAIKWYTQNYEYDGNGNPIQTEHISSRGSVQTYQYQYDYDSDGSITGYSSTEYYEGTPGFSDTYILSYDDQGRVIGRRDEYGASVEEFSYDESKKLVYESSDLYWGDGHFVGKTEYDYTYAPLVISTSTSESKEYGNSSSKSISFKPHWNLTIASGTISDSCSFDVDSSGYLLRVIDENGDNVYVCNYQEVKNEDSNSNFPSSSSADHLVAVTYISAIERVANNDLCSNICGFLFDLDSDKTDELVLYYGLREEYYSIPTHTFDVYDVENGQLVTRLEKIDIGSADVGGSSGNIGVEYHNGIPVIATYARNGWSSPGYYVFDASYEIKLYDCHTYSSTRSISVDVDEHDSGYTITHIIDGEELSEDSFHQEIAQYKRIFLDDYDSYSYVSWNYKATGQSFEQKLTVYDLLRYLQQTAKIAPESPPVLMQDDAEEIAYSIWGEYLERTQGFDWKIFEEHSIIKNGIEYYCYTLNTNSRYGEEDWSIHNYLFVNSVSGEYDHTLF